MRMNVYSQELPLAVASVSKTDERGRVHWGVRIFFDGSLRRDFTADDDASSAVTCWIPGDGSFTPTDLGDVFARAARLAYSLCRE